VTKILKVIPIPMVACQLNSS